MELSQCEFLRKLGKEICAARKRQNMSQAELAEKADLSITYISKIECGHKNISAYTLARNTEALNVPSSEIIAKACRDKTSIIREAVEEAKYSACSKAKRRGRNFANYKQTNNQIIPYKQTAVCTRFELHTAIFCKKLHCRTTVALSFIPFYLHSL